MAFAANSNTKNDLPSTVFVKLDRDNYPLWRSFVLPIIRGCKLDGYMLGTKLCPAEFITKVDANALTIKQLNPTYEDGQACDQQLLSWLKNFMTQDLATQLLHCENSKKLWEDYDWYFDSGASNHVTHHTDKFQDLTEHHDKNSLFVGNGNSQNSDPTPVIAEATQADTNPKNSEETTQIEDVQDSHIESDHVNNSSPANNSVMRPWITLRHQTLLNKTSQNHALALTHTQICIPEANQAFTKPNYHTLD
ncbi:hypothetical protein KIW84_045334 [Lathyrus oleraceus]|uniref:Retrovirus-related Pol polyprotein from transposon TNT 1-94-like beta-barrel domain-containing protein n=1 Tax=Pisum sativum TaxID=3888 RepID=A0A9D5AWL5_PEA|nr:hypothetical protein KIW84_045334 [Pisum sativum]